MSVGNHYPTQAQAPNSFCPVIQLAPTSWTIPTNCETGQTFDRDHNGISGITAEEVLTGRLSGWLNAVTPDTVLLTLGANDFKRGASLTTIETRLNATWFQLASARQLGSESVSIAIVSSDRSARVFN